MANLTIKDIINNVIDELQRAKESIKDKCEGNLLPHDAELFDDVDKSIERLSSIENTVLVALVAAVYAGNLESDGKAFNGDFGADSLDHRREYLAMAEQYDLPYTKDGLISSEDVYNDISDMVQKKYHREGIVGEFAYVCGAWCQIMGKRYVNGEPEYSLYSKEGWIPQYHIKDFRAKGDF